MLSKVDNEFKEEINTLCKEYGEENEPLFVELFNKMMINAFGNNKSEIYESMKNISMINFIPESTTLSLDNIKDYNGHEILSSRKEKVFEIFKNDTFSFFPELRKRKVVNKDIYDKINHISLNLSSIDDLIKNGWSIKQNFAQDFANKMGVKVIAPSDTVWAHPSGKLTIGPKSYIDIGHWNEFKPRKRGKKQ